MYYTIQYSLLALFWPTHIYIQADNIIREHSFMSDLLCVEFEVVLLAWAGQLIRFYTILYLDSLKDAKNCPDIVLFSKN